MALMELELTQFQKFQKVFGLSMVPLLVFSKWVNVLMETLPMLVHIKIT